MNRLDSTLQRLRQQQRSGLACYFTAGDPDYARSLELLRSLASAGADVIELGLPFSDSVADGPAIQQAHLRALAAGQTVARTLQLVAELRSSDATTPVVLMGYLNPVMQYGPDFMAAAAQAGVDGLLLVDLPMEHAAPWQTAAERAGLHLIRMTAPTSDDARLQQVLADASGMVYHVTVTGTTGQKSAVAADIAKDLARLRRHTDLPLAAGFGIRTPEQARALAAHADLVVVGSRLVEVLNTDGMDGALQAIRELAVAVQGRGDAVWP